MSSCSIGKRKETEGQLLLMPRSRLFAYNLFRELGLLTQNDLATLTVCGIFVAPFSLQSA